MILELKLKSTAIKYGFILKLEVKERIVAVAHQAHGGNQQQY